MPHIRGPKIEMVFQDPMTSLDPTMRVGRQIMESLNRHLGMSGRRAAERAVELLKMVGIPNTKECLKQYPHQFSGGMRQRVVIAIALACDPKVLIADEPTTAARRRRAPGRGEPGRAFVYGLISLPIFFVLCVVLAVSIIGIPLLLLLAPAYLALLFFGALVAAFFIGTRVLMFTGRYRVGNAMAAVVGALILAATTLIPVLGDLLLYALSLLGTGAVILALLSRRSPRATHPSYEAYVRE